MLKFALDGITAFSEIPLRLATWFGFFVSAIGFLVALFEVGLRVFTGYNLPGYTSTIFAILFLGGVQLSRSASSASTSAASTTRSKAARSTWSPKRRQRARRARRTRCRARFRSPGSCARSRRRASSSVVIGCGPAGRAQPVDRRDGAVLVLAAQHVGHLDVRDRGGRSSAANTARARSFQLRSTPAPTL